MSHSVLILLRLIFSLMFPLLVLLMLLAANKKISLDQAGSGACTNIYVPQTQTHQSCEYGKTVIRPSTVYHIKGFTYCQVTLDISGSPIDFQWGSQKYPGSAAENAKSWFAQQTTHGWCLGGPSQFWVVRQSIICSDHEINWKLVKMGQSECAFYLDTSTNGHMISVHRWNHVPSFIPKYFLQNLKNSLVAKRTIDGGTLGRPVDSWVGFGDRVTMFQQHCQDNLTGMCSHLSFRFFPWNICCASVCSGCRILDHAKQSHSH